MFIYLYDLIIQGVQVVQCNIIKISETTHKKIHFITNN